MPLNVGSEILVGDRSLKILKAVNVFFLDCRTTG
jgi:aminoglycoside phosphotransferase family enzyme